MTTGRYQSIVVRSDPPGATCRVRQGGEILGAIAATPGTVRVDKQRGDIAIDCARPGHYPGAAVVQARLQDAPLDSASLTNWPLAVASLAVDASTGTIKDYPRSVTVLMKPLSSGVASSQGVTRAQVMRMEETASARRHGIPTTAPD